MKHSQLSGTITSDGKLNVTSVINTNGITWKIGDTYKIEKTQQNKQYLTIDRFDVAVDGKTILAIATTGGGVSIDKIIKYNPQDDITSTKDFKWDDEKVKEFFERFKNIERFTIDQLIDLYKQSKLKNKK